MRPVSPRFLRTLAGSHVMVARATVCTTFQTGTAPVGTRIPIVAGDLTFDAHADIRATLDLTTDGAGMFPDTAQSLLAPYGNEVFVERGIDYGGGQLEWVSQGYYRIENPAQDVAPDGPIQLAASDRMAGIVDARLERPLQFAGNLTYDTVVGQLVRAVYPDAVIEWPDGGGTDFLLRTVIAEEDRYGFLNDLITAKAKIWYWDHRGVLVIKNPPNPGNPVWTVNAGKGGVLVSMSRELSRTGVYNTWVVTGEAGDSTPPSRGVARDNNVDSPTYWLGRFGPVPGFFSSPFITSNAQAVAAATAKLRTSLGLPYNVEFESVANPALEVWDPVQIAFPERARSASLQTETHIIEQLKLGLTYEDPTSAKTREQTVVLISTEEG